MWPKATKVLEGLLPVAMLFYPSAIIEVLTYGPMLGSGGTYLSFVTGNISNLKLPCALNSMENAKVRATSEEGDVISTISIATSSIVTTLIIALGVVAFSPILPYITDPNSAFAPAFQQVVPALFGCAGRNLFCKTLEDFDPADCGGAHCTALCGQYGNWRVDPGRRCCVAARRASYV